MTSWVWAEAPAANPSFKQRVEWYEEHVYRRPLWVPLGEATYWFLKQLPQDIEHQGPQDVDGWVEGVAPIYAEPSLFWSTPPSSPG